MSKQLSPNLKFVDYTDANFWTVQFILRVCGLLHEECDTREAFKKKIEHDPGSIILAKQGEQIVGAVVIIFDLWQSSLYRLAVLPKWRHQGIGRALANEAFKRLKNRGANLVCFFVHPENYQMLDFCRRRFDFKDYGSYRYLAKFFNDEMGKKIIEKEE